jgi:hypothetical protein
VLPSCHAGLVQWLVQVGGELALGSKIPGIWLVSTVTEWSGSETRDRLTSFALCAEMHERCPYDRREGGERR